MMEYLARIFPILSNETNETAVERTVFLSDIINLVEFLVFLMLRSVLDTFFSVCFGLVKFGIVLLLTYGFAFCIFYYFDNFVPKDDSQPSTSKLRRISERSKSDDLQKNSGEAYPHVIDYDSKWDKNDKKSTLKLAKSNILSSSVPMNNNDEKTTLNSLKSDIPLRSFEKENSTSNKSKNSKLDTNDQKSTLPSSKIGLLLPNTLDVESYHSDEAVVRVGSFKRSSIESGKQSIVSKALADLENIEAKTNSVDSEPKSVSITKTQSEDLKSSNA